MTANLRNRRLATALLSGLGLFAWLAPSAAAEFGPIQLVSKSATEQAGFAKEPALSGNGEYVAFDGELGGRTGIFRKDLDTGALTLVAEGAAAPSISAEGRYVSFTTNQALDPLADEGETEDVYVADLASSPPLFQLVSAEEREGREQRMGGTSSAAPRVAISASGGEVAFINDEQVYVRRLADASPVLISARRDSAPGGMTSEPVPGGGAWSNAGAALSADGNAVAWVGEDLPDQVPVSPSEEEEIRAIEAHPFSPSELYFEPLWREVPAGVVSTATKRVVGGSGGSFPDLIESDRLALGENEGVGWGTNLPVLSADGRTMAVIGSPEEDNDLFLTHIDPGVDAVPTVSPLTRWTNPEPSNTAGGEHVFEELSDLVFTGPIKQCAISPDGTRVAFTTVRQAFALSPPALTTPRPVPLPTVPELYQVDLLGGSIERVTPGPGTAVSEAFGVEIREIGRPDELARAKYGEAQYGASGPSYSADGRLLAFSSAGFNLTAGDGNEASDVFTVETPPPSPIEPSKISPRPAAISVIPSWRLSVHAVSRPNGAVRIVAGVPGAGTLSARAQSRFGSARRPHKVSRGQRRSGAAGVLRLELTLPRKLRKLSRQKGGLYTTLDVQFTGPGGKPLKQLLVARFRAHHPVKHKKGKNG